MPTYMFCSSAPITGPAFSSTYLSNNFASTSRYAFLASWQPQTTEDNFLVKAVKKTDSCYCFTTSLHANEVYALVIKSVCHTVSIWINEISWFLAWRLSSAFYIALQGEPKKLIHTVSQQIFLQCVPIKLTFVRYECDTQYHTMV